MHLLANMMQTPLLLLFVVVLAMFALPSLQQSNPTPTFVSYDCLNTTGNYTQGSNYQFNLNNTLTFLTLNSSSSSFYVASTGVASDTVYGRYFCRNDLSSTVCSACVQAAAKKIISKCPNNKEAVVWFEQCTLLYLTNSSRLDAVNEASPWAMWYTPENVTDPDSFNTVLQSTMNRVINESAYGLGSDGFATEEEKVSPFKTLYSMAQCSPDRVGLLCEKCLRKALRHVDLCCNNYADMAFFYSTCTLRYSVLAPFYEVPNPPPGTPPPAPTVASPGSLPPTKSNQQPPGNWAIARNKNDLNFGPLLALTTLILLGI